MHLAVQETVPKYCGSRIDEQPTGWGLQLKAIERWVHCVSLFPVPEVQSSVEWRNEADSRHRLVVGNLDTSTMQRTQAISLSPSVGRFLE